MALTISCARKQAVERALHLKQFGVDVDRDVLAELLVSGLEAFEDGCELLSDDVSDELLSVPLVLVLSVHELPDGELGKDTEDSLVVVSDTGCELAG